MIPFQVNQYYFPLDRCESTIDEVRRLAQEGYREGTFVTARAQTKGRGRHGNEWLSAPDKGLYLSFLLTSRPFLLKPSLVSAATSAAAAEALSELSTRQVYLKWPNDLLLDLRKIGGVLVEASSQGATPDHLIVGLGVNLNQEREDLPERPLFPATSLLLETGSSWEPQLLLHKLIPRLNTLLQHILEGGSSEVVDLYHALWEDRNRRVVVRDDGQEWEGLAEAVAEDGALILRRDDGSAMVLRTGTLFYQAS